MGRENKMKSIIFCALAISLSAYGCRLIASESSTQAQMLAKMLLFDDYNGDGIFDSADHGQSWRDVEKYVSNWV
jgi:hypothetical protein